MYKSPHWFRVSSDEWMKITRRWTLKTAPVRAGWWLAEIYDPIIKRTVECMTFEDPEAARRWADEAARGILKPGHVVADPDRKWWKEGA